MLFSNGIIYLKRKWQISADYQINSNYIFLCVWIT